MTDRMDKISLQVDAATRTIRIEYWDLDDDWFNDLGGAIEEGGSNA